jgi:hypothetical protein
VNRAELQRKFPNASEAFLKANEDRNRLQNTESQHVIRHDPLEKAPAQAWCSRKVIVSITSFRKRLIDPDNLCPKYLIDGLRYAGLISGDSPDLVTLQISQVKSHRERTVVEIIPSDVSRSGNP